MLYQCAELLEQPRGCAPRGFRKTIRDLMSVGMSHVIHSVFCLTTGPKPPPKRCLHIVRSRASSNESKIKKQQNEYVWQRLTLSALNKAAEGISHNRQTIWKEEIWEIFKTNIKIQIERWRIFKKSSR